MAKTKQRTVRMTRIQCGPDVNRQPGQLVTVPAEEAAALIKAGAAEDPDAAPEDTAPAEDETETAQRAAPETAASRTGGKQQPAGRRG